MGAPIGSGAGAHAGAERGGQPLVSIILPVLNAERFLAQALASIHAQTYPNYEIVVIDGGSTDATPRLAQAAARARFITQSEPGLANAWNTGLRAARGEFISFLDSDDWWSPDKLARQVTVLDQNPQLQFVIARVKLVLEPGCPVPERLSPAVFEGSHVGHMPGTLLARRALFDQIGLFEQHWRIASDIEWFARLEAEAAPGATLSETLLYRRIHETNLTQVSGPSLMKSELLLLLKQSLDRRRERQRAAHEGADANGA